VRIEKWRAEAKLGVTPCPGEVGAPSGARVRGYRMREKKLERYMDYEWWEKKFGVVVEDREEGEEGDKVVEESEEELDEIEVENDGVGEMVNLLVDEQREKNQGSVSVAQQALDVLNLRKDSVMG
jgi:transcriptional regulator NrdR family protein